VSLRNHEAGAQPVSFLSFDKVTMRTIRSEFT
jgi:hypothetical protein